MCGDFADDIAVVSAETKQAEALLTGVETTAKGVWLIVNAKRKDDKYGTQPAV